MLIDDAAKVAAMLDVVNVDEDTIFAETRLPALKQAAGLPFAIIEWPWFVSSHDGERLLRTAPIPAAPMIAA